MELIEELKARLKIEDVVGRDEKLKPAGPGKFVGVEHDSLHVDAPRGLWSWFSRQPAPGKQVCGGDVFSWLAYRRFSTVDVGGEQFGEVLKIACELAGLRFDDYRARDPRGAERAAARRKREAVLEKFVRAAEAARDADTAAFFHRVKLPVVQSAKTGSPVTVNRKPYLTEAACRAWRIGKAPNLTECRAAELAEPELAEAGLLVVPSDARKPYLFFRDRFIIPFIEAGRVVWLAGRAFADAAADGREIKKILYLPVR